MNHAAERIFGYTTEEAMQLNMSQIAAPEHIEMARSNLSKKIDGSVTQTGYELDCVRKDGTRLTLEVNSSVISKDGVPVVVRESPRTSRSVNKPKKLTRKRKPVSRPV